MSSSPDHVYLDLATVNNDMVGTYRQQLSFTETRTADIIDNPSNYFMSVVRFEVDTPGASLPLFIPKMLIDGENVDIDKTAYSITIGKPNTGTGLLDDAVSRYVEWSQQDKTTALPNNQLENTGLPSTDLNLATPFSIVNNQDGFNINTLPLTNPSAILGQVNTPLVSPQFSYVGSPILNMSSIANLNPIAVNLALAVPAVANGGANPFQITVGVFQTPFPALLNFNPLTPSFLQLVISYTLSGLVQTPATATCRTITQVQISDGAGGFYYQYVLNGNSNTAQFAGATIVITNIQATNSATDQFLGKVPQIIGSNYLSSSVINSANFDTRQMNFDDNYFNLPPTRTQPIVPTALTAQLSLSNLNWGVLYPSFAYNATTWSAGAIGLPTATLATGYTYEQTPQSKVTFTLSPTLVDADLSVAFVSIIEGANNVYTMTMTISTTERTSTTITNLNASFLLGSTLNWRLKGSGTTFTNTINQVSPVSIIPFKAPGSSDTTPAFQFTMTLQFAGVALPSATEVALALGTFSNVSLQIPIPNNTSIVLNSAPLPTPPTTITATNTVVGTNDFIAQNSTFLGVATTPYPPTEDGLYQVFELSYNATFYPIFGFNSTIQYNQLTFTVSPITPTLSTQDITTGYYNCYSVKWWLNCVNRTLALLWADIGGLVNYAPQMVVDSNTNLITLMTPYITSANTPFVNFAVSDNVASTASYLGTGSNPAITHSIFFNEPMFNLFSAFPSIRYGNTITNAQLNGASQLAIDGVFSKLAYYIQATNYNFKNTHLVNSSLVSQPQEWFITESEYSPVPIWNPIASLIFSTTFLPVVMSLTTTPTVFGSNPYDKTYIANNGNTSNISTMISDIQVPLVSGSEYKPTVLYNPASEYRMIDLLGQVPPKQASFTISFKTKFGEIIPFTLGSLCGANLKIMFRRKRYNLGNTPPYNTN
jgi:hypothetical protein